MYAGFFGLEQAPFSIAPDPRYLYLSERHREALAHLLYGLEGGGGFVVLTGEIGAGKTTLCRHFLAQAPAHCRVAYIFNPQLSVVDLLATICHEFGIPEPAAPIDPNRTKPWLDTLNTHLLSAHAAGAVSVLVIDEAQSLSADVLEQLRLLTNLETNERKLLQIMLIGQPQLRALLDLPELEQLAQRVIARYHLDALNADETHRYVEHRLRTAGLGGPLPFTEEALDRVFAHSHGIPRRINLLCERALLGAYAQHLRRISPAIVNHAADELFGAGPAQKPSTPPSARRPGWLAAPGALVGAALVGAALGMLLSGRFPSEPSGAPVTASLPPNPAPVLAAESATQGASQGPHATEVSEPQPPPEPQSAADSPPPVATASRETAAAVDTLPLDGRLLQDSEGAALTELAQHWPLQPLADEPCASALLQQHQCYRMPRMTLRALQAFDRPAVLRLYPPEGPPGYALLKAWDGDRLLIAARGRSWTLPPDALERLWRGEYASYWRTPAPLGRHLHNGADPQVRPWLTEALAELQRQGRLPPAAQDLQAKIMAFQRAQGLDPTGQASPTTLILINRATGVAEPRLRVAGLSDHTP